jgi:hypothetical protein
VSDFNDGKVWRRSNILCALTDRAASVRYVAIAAMWVAMALTY